MKCWCCGRTGGKFITMTRCKGKPITVGVRCGCAVAFVSEWEHAVDQSRVDIWKHTKWIK